MTITLEEALVKMFITAIICLFVYLAINMILRWIRQMAEDGLPMFTYGSLEWKTNSDKDEIGTTPIGFATTEETPTEKKSEKEIKESYMSDPITMTAALLRGEVDIDDITT